MAGILALVGLPVGTSAQGTPGFILGDTIAAVGTPGQPWSVTDSTEPVDVVRTEEFSGQGAIKLPERIRAVISSFNVASHLISDTATILRPASLGTLAHDHTLVLPNGKRRHRSSAITWSGGATDRSQGPDLSSIPSFALRPKEVLCHGAPAAVCITPDPNQVMYVSNSNPPDNLDVGGEIYKMELDGTIVGRFGTAGKLLGQFGSVDAIDCRDENELLVGDLGNWRVQRVTLQP